MLGCHVIVMPMPQLKVRYISASANIACALQPIEHFGRSQVCALSSTSSHGNDARNVLGQPATGDVREAVNRHVLRQRQQRLDVDARRRSSASYSRPAVELRRGVAFAVLRSLRISE